MTSPEPAPVPAVDEARVVNELIAARTLISVALNELTELLPWSIWLEDTHQRSTWVMSSGAAESADAAVLKDRAAHWANLRQGVKITGPIVAPVTVAVVSLQDETVRVLCTFVSRAERAARDAGIDLYATTSRLAVSRSTVGGFGWLRDHACHVAAYVTNPATLRHLARDLERLAEDARRVVDGATVAHLHYAPCPFCGVKSLLVDHDAGTIRCDVDPRTRRRHPCVCADPLCGCKTDPVGHRHTWRRDAGRSITGWDHLAQLLQVHRAATTGADQ